MYGRPLWPVASERLGKPKPAARPRFADFKALWEGEEARRKRQARPPRHGHIPVRGG